jgi:hypothetical protein
MMLLASLLVFAAVPAGVLSQRLWRRRPDLRLPSEARHRHPTAIEPVEPPSGAVRVLRSADEVTSALERAKASAAHVAATRASRRRVRPRSRLPG